MKDKVLKAAALRYPEWADAPYICAAAQGRGAGKILEIAEENNIPVVENSALADVLSIQKFGTLIPEETYSAVAAVFAFIARIEKEL